MPGGNKHHCGAAAARSEIVSPEDMWQEQAFSSNLAGLHLEEQRLLVQRDARARVPDSDLQPATVVIILVLLLAEEGLLVRLHRKRGGACFVAN